METEIELSKIYSARFADTATYRNRVWKILTSRFFSRWIPETATVLDLGCGYGEFSNNVMAGKKLAMDLNPDCPSFLNSDITFLRQDCAGPWQVPDASLDVVFTSNFFEHLPDKDSLKKTLAEALRCLRPDGRLLAMGPNIKFLPGLYWDFFDHHTILTEASLAEVLMLTGFEIERVVPRFLPYTLINAPQPPLIALRLYLKLPWLWWIKGRQFFVVARKPLEADFFPLKC
jgi:SAM-dependent methyltransferase